MSEYFPVDGDTAPLTVGKQIDNWIDSQRIERSTKAGYTSAGNFWRRALPDKLIKGLAYSDILRVLAARKDLSGKTLNNYTSVLREALDLAVRDKILRENPSLGVPSAKWQREPPDPFTREESAAIIESMQARHSGQVANMVEFWFWTGARTSEVLGLQWPNIDLAKGSALVTDALVKGHRKNTKTNVARTVTFNSRATAAIQRQRAHTQVAGASVFCDPRTGESWSDEKRFRRDYWIPTLKLLGIRYRRPYNMRHSYATAMLMAGMTPAFCARQLGHSVEIFLRTYSKWMDGEQNDMEMQRLEATLSPVYPRKKADKAISPL